MKCEGIIAKLVVIEQRKTALRSATQNIGMLIGREAVQSIHFGEPVYAAFGMRRAEAKQHERAELLLLVGENVPLMYCD